MPDSPTPVAPVRKTVTVSVPAKRAFEIFTSEIGAWWPLATNSVGLEHSTGISLGTAVGDQLVETLADGTTSVWGTVVRSDPPHQLAITWHAGQPPEQATLLEITFTEEEGGTTVVELLHSGWERVENGDAMANGYREGWDQVLSCFTARTHNSPD